MRRCLLVFAVVIECLHGAVDTVWLTWQRDPCTTMSIQWLSEDKDSNSQVVFHSVTDSSLNTAFGSHRPLPGTNNAVLVHSVEIFGLSPDTRYAFQIDQEERERYFHTLPSTLTRPVRFVAGGDVYHTTIEVVEQAHKQAAKANPDFALVGGDIAYSVFSKAAGHNAEKVDRWKEFLRAWSQHMITPDGDHVPILPALGNHDVIGGYRQPESRAACYYVLFPTSGDRGYRALDFGNYLALFLLDSGHTHDIGGKQTEWLENKLEKRANVLHKIAVYHVGAWPSVREENAREEPGLIRKNWIPLFEKYGLSVGFEHHAHAYKRTHLIRNMGISPHGILYLGDGAWGVSPRKPHPPSKRWYLAKTAQKQHVIIAEFTPYTRSYFATDTKGYIFDSFIQFIPFSAGPEPLEGKKTPHIALDPRLFLPVLAM